MMIKMGEINKSLAVLKGKNFYVRVDKVGESSYKVTYPPYNIFEPKFEGFSKEYSITPDGFVVMDGERVGLPKSLERIGILADIYSQCRYLGLNPTLLFFFNEKGEEVKDFFELAGSVLGEDDLRQEKIVYKMLMNEDVSDEDGRANFRSWKVVKGLSI